MKLKSNCPVCNKEYTPVKQMSIAEEIAKIIYEKTASYTKSHTNNGLVRKTWEDCSMFRKRSYLNAAHAINEYFKNKNAQVIFHPPEPV